MIFGILLNLDMLDPDRESTTFLVMFASGLGLALSGIVSGLAILVLETERYIGPDFGSADGAPDRTNNLARIRLCYIPSRSSGSTAAL